MRGVVQKIEETNGVNQNTGKPWSKTTYTINGEWIGDFNGWKGGKSGVVEGDTVDYEFEQKGKFKNLVSIQKATGEAPAQQAGAPVAAQQSGGNGTTDDRIARSVALKGGIESAPYHEKGGKDLERVKWFTNRYMDYLQTGSWEVTDAKEVLGGQVVDEELPPTSAYGV